MPTSGNKILYSFSSNGHSGFFIGLEGPNYTVNTIDITTADDKGTATGTGNQDQDWTNAIFRKKVPGTIEPGQVTLTVAFDGTKKWPIIAENENLTLTWPLLAGQTQAATVVLSGHVAEFNITGGGDLDNPLQASIVFECSGEPTLTDAS